MTRIAMDAAKVREAVKAGHTAEILRQLQLRAGIAFDGRLGKIGFLNQPSEDTIVTGDLYGPQACDAQPELVTVSNAGIPAWLTNYFDPRVIEIVTSPLKAAEIIGSEEKKGDWTTTTATFLVVEHVGETSSYGDFSNNGMAGANMNFPQRQSYAYQVFTQWGEKQLAMAGDARVNYANEVTTASLKIMAQFQNLSYFFGVSGLQNYGLLNDPSLYPAIVATAPWTASGTTPESIYEDVRRLVQQLINQTNGVLDASSQMTLAMSPILDTTLDKTNQFGLSTRNQLSKHFPNLTVKTAVQYGQQTGGNLVQLIANNLNGVRTATAAFTEKMRAHAVVVGHSSWSQKKSAGTFGTIIFEPTAIAQMSGA